MPSVFTKIVNREIPAYIVAEDEAHLAFLDVNPLKQGHTLVIPKKETDYLFDLSESEYLHLQAFARRVALALEQAVDCRRIGVAVLGLEVPHAHIHLVPIDAEGDLSFARERVRLSKDAMQSTAEQINAAYRDFAG